jgi:hypothetical protein
MVKMMTVMAMTMMTAFLAKCTARPSHDECMLLRPST